jgi:AcrR family transcriptional regulator
LTAVPGPEYGVHQVVNETVATVRRKQAAARRSQILAAARRLFAENGYHSTSIRDVHRQVGVSDGLLYHYFPSKNDLLQAVLDDAVASIGQQHLALDLPRGLDTPTAVRLALRRLWQLWSENEEVMRILLRGHDPGAGTLALASMIPATGLAGLLEERMGAGEMRRLDPLLAARLLMDQALGLWVSHMTTGAGAGGRGDPLESLDLAVDQFWHGWKPG